MKKTNSYLPKKHTKVTDEILKKLAKIAKESQKTAETERKMKEKIDKKYENISRQ